MSPALAGRFFSTMGGPYIKYILNVLNSPNQIIQDLLQVKSVNAYNFVCILS